MLVDMTFAHGITEVRVAGVWRLLEPVGNACKWVVWTGDEKRAGDMPVPFNPDGDSLFAPEKRTWIELLPESCVDRDPAMISLIESIDSTRPSPHPPVPAPYRVAAT